jgi:mutator protein MutT
MISMYDRRYAIFVLRDKQGRIVLQKRDKNAPKHPLHWSFFGGNIENGETPEQAVKREAMEELGLRSVRFRFFGRYDVKDGNELNEIFLFVCNLDTPLDTLRANQKEGEDLGLFSYEDIKSLKIPEANIALLRELFGATKKSGVMYVQKE